MDNNLIFGIRPVAEAIEAGRRIEKLYIRKGAEGQLMSELRDLCFRHRIRVQEVPVEKLNRLTRGNHQGVVAQTAAIEYVEPADILERVPEDETPLIVVFDGVTDVRNFGAIARSAECAGAHGLIAPLKNSAPVNAEAIRSSAGALTTIPVARVGSIRNTLKQLQQEGFQVVAATEKSRKLLYDADFRKPTVLVMGAEDTGISKEVLKLCDEQLAIPLIGHIESLNVSAAAAVMLFEVVRQRIGGTAAEKYTGTRTSPGPDLLSGASGPGLAHFPSIGPAEAPHARPAAPSRSKSRPGTSRAARDGNEAPPRPEPLRAKGRRPERTARPTLRTYLRAHSRPSDQKSRFFDAVTTKSFR